MSSELLEMLSYFQLNAKPVACCFLLGIACFAMQCVACAWPTIDPSQVVWDWDGDVEAAPTWPLFWLGHTRGA